MFWDDFSSDGEAWSRSEKGRLCGSAFAEAQARGRTKRQNTHFCSRGTFPNRTPERCGWHAPEGDEKTIIGNWYATRFSDAWAAAEYAAANLDTLEARTRRFAKAMRESTLPAQMKEAATANLSTLVTPTCFRTADGEFHGFEGIDDHVRLLPRQLHARLELRDRDAASVSRRFARSLRGTPSVLPWMTRGAMYFRAILPRRQLAYGLRGGRRPDGPDHQAYLDWQLSGDNEWLRRLLAAASRRRSNSRGCPAAGTPIATASWKACSTTPTTSSSTGRIRYAASITSGALRAAEEMARAVGDTARPRNTGDCFESGSKWIDAEPFQRRILRPADSRRAKPLKSPMACAAAWARTIPSTRNIRLAPDA